VIEDWRVHARVIGNVAKGGLALALAIAGRHDEVRAELQGAITPGIILSQLAAEAILVIGDRERAEHAFAALVPALELYPMTAGPAGSLMLRPVALAIGELALLLGRRDRRADVAHRLRPRRHERALVAAGQEVRCPHLAAGVRAERGDRDE